MITARYVAALILALPLTAPPAAAGLALACLPHVALTSVLAAYDEIDKLDKAVTCNSYEDLNRSGLELVAFFGAQLDSLKAQNGGSVNVEKSETLIKGAKIRSVADKLKAVSSAPCVPAAAQARALLYASKLEGLVVDHYYKWGPAKGDAGALAFRDLRNAVQKAPELLEVWVAYGQALARISRLTWASRKIAEHKMGIRVADELQSVLSHIETLKTNGPAISPEDLAKVSDFATAYDNIK